MNAAAIARATSYAINCGDEVMVTVGGDNVEQLAAELISALPLDCDQK